MQLFVVYFQKAALDNEFSLALSLLNFVEYEANDARNDAQFLIFDPNGIPGAHCVRLTRPRLPIRQNGRIEALEAAEDQIFDAQFVDVLLDRVQTKAAVKSECTILTNYDLVFIFAYLHTNI